MLIDRKHRQRVLWLSAISAAVAAVTATVTLTNIRIYEGVLPVQLLLGTLGFDVMSLVISVALVACLLALFRRREQYWLAWIGLQGYLLYAYAIYAFGNVMTALYFAYLVIVGCSAYALALFGRSLNLRVLRHWPKHRLPRRTMGAVLVFMATLFALAWTSMLLTAITNKVDIPAATVIVLDLSFALPLLALVGSLLLLRRPLGDILAPGIFALSAAITLAVALGEFMSPVFGIPIDGLAVVPYLIPASVCLAFAVLAFRRVGGVMHREHP